MDVPASDTSEAFLFQHALDPFQQEIAAERIWDTTTVADPVEISLNAVIDRVQVQYGNLEEKIASGLPEAGLEDRLKQTEERLDELNGRLEGRRREMGQQRECMVGNIRRLGRAGVGEVALSSNEYHTARPGWKPISVVEHYSMGAVQIRENG